MKNLRYMVMVPAVALSVAAVTLHPQHAMAASTSSNTCSVKAVGATNTVGKSDSRFVINNGTATVKFTVTGANCDVTFASWQAPDGKQGLPYSAQKLYAHTTGTFNAGTHELSVAVPDCFYQLDLVQSKSPTDSKGGPQYRVVDNTPMVAWLHGGTQACTTPTTPETPTTPDTPEVPETPVSDLPNTGVGSTVAFVSAGAAVLGTVVARIRMQRKNA